LPGRRIAATFAGTAGQTILINGTSGAFNSTLTLYDPKGSQIASGYSYASDSGSAKTWIAPVNLSATGTYTLYVTPAAGGTGTVSLQVLTDATMTATIDGAAVSSTITSALPGRRIAATFSGTAGQRVYVNGSSGTFNSSVTLVDPKGVQIASGSSLSTDLGLRASWISPTNLSATGTYTLYFTPSAGATGTITFQVIGSFVTASTGVNGLPTSVTIPSSTPGKIMAITFSGSAGSAVSMLGITGAIGGTLAVYDPDGLKIASGIAVPLYPCPDEEPPGTCPQVLVAPVTLPITGTYTVYFTPAAVNTGSVSVWVTGVSGTPPTVTTINTSATVDGAIVPVTIPTAAAGNRVAVTFSASAGQTVYVNNSSNSMSCSGDTYSLVGPGGQIVVPSYSPTLYLCNLTSVLAPTGLPAAGTYTLYIFPDASQHGTANLQVLSSLPTVSATVDGAIVPVSIPTTSPGQRLAITFSGTVGQAVYINNSSNAMSCGSDTYSLIGPSGQIVVPAYTPTLYLCNLTNILTATGLPATGTYTFYITPDGTQHGTANLQVLSQYVNVAATVDGAIVPVTIPATAPGQRAAITFSGTAGQAVYLNNSSNSMSCGSDTYSLVGSNGQIVIPAYSPTLYLCNLTNVLMATGLPVAGTYTFYIVPNGTQHGAANLQVLSQYVNVAATADGAIVPVTIPATAPGERAAITFSGTAGQTVYINNSSNSMSCGSDTYSLVGPNGQIIIPAYSPTLYLCNLTNVLAATGLPATGTYTLYIVPNGTQTGAANLQVLSQYVNVAATVDGAIAPVTIPATAPGERAAITFSGTAGQTVYINNSSNSMSCGSDTYSLVGPNGQIVIPAYSPTLYLCNLTNVLAATGLPATGTYTFYIVPSGPQQGTANLQVLSKDLAVSATVGGAGVPVTIPDTSPGQRVALTFAGTAGQAVFITSVNTSMSCGGDTYSLIGPNGQPVVLNYSPSLYLCNATSLLQPTGLPATGTYTFYVIPDGAQHGTATVQVQQYGP
jgi:nitrous oxide reductase accessory protein NosL